MLVMGWVFDVDRPQSSGTRFGPTAEKISAKSQRENRRQAPQPHKAPHKQALGAVGTRVPYVE